MADSNYQSIFKSEVNKRLVPILNNSLLKEEDLISLPNCVQNYLRVTNCIGKPKVRNFRAVFSGGMKRSYHSDWMKIDSVQYNFMDCPARFFYIKSKLFKIPFDGLHVFANNEATMKIKIASLFRVVDAKGEKMNQSETVTLFNDMCLLAPATLICKNIAWNEIDGHTVGAVFTNNKISISAILTFNDDFELINFTSNDRFLSADGKKFFNYKWSTPVKNYKDFNGYRLESQGEAIWTMPEGDFKYAKFTTVEVQYNCVEMK